MRLNKSGNGLIEIQHYDFLGRLSPSSVYQFANIGLESTLFVPFEYFLFWLIVPPYCDAFLNEQ